VADYLVVAKSIKKNGQGNPDFSEGGNEVRLVKSYNFKILEDD
jgi:hypothetical protein